MSDKKPLSQQLAGNNLLRALRPEDFAALEPALHRIRAERGTIFYEPGDDVRFAYFPCGASLASFITMLDDGKPIETALVGREGAIGGIVSQGQLPAYARSMVLLPGEFLRIETTALEAAKQRSFPLRHLFARYSDCLLAQIFQSVACNAAHSIEQRTAKWLLAAIERTGGLDISITQEDLANMLGIGRSYLSSVVLALRDRGIVKTRRGGLILHDLTALKALACGCNETVRDHFEVVLRGVYPNNGDLVG